MGAKSTKCLSALRVHKTVRAGHDRSIERRWQGSGMSNIALQWTDTDRVTAPPGAPLASAAWLRSKRSGGGGGR